MSMLSNLDLIRRVPLFSLLTNEQALISPLRLRGMSAMLTRIKRRLRDA